MSKISNEFLDFVCGKIAGYGYDNGLSNSEIDIQIAKYASKYHVTIPPCHSMTKKMDKLRNAIACFNPAQQVEIISGLCSLKKFEEDMEIEQIQKTLTEEYGFLQKDSISQTELIQETKHWLDNYPSVLKQYGNALAKYEGGIFERNTLDDMRLAFELLVKDLLENGKSLENQIPEIGAKLKATGASAELRNMVPQIIKYYTDFQNNHVKHNDEVNANEIEYVIELTSVVMKFLIKAIGGTN